MKPARLFRSLTDLALVAVLLPLAGCIINVLPEIESDSASSGDDGATTDGVPTTGGPADETGAPTTGLPGETGEPGVGGECDFAGAIQPIFDASCVACHGAQPAQGLTLAAGSSYAALVGVDSVGAPGTSLVAAGDPGDSWLVHKLGPNPSQGDRMPLGGALAQGQIDVISAWIAAGAPETATFACGEQPASDVGGVEIPGARQVQVQVGEIVDLEAVVTTPENEPAPDVVVTWTSDAELTLYVDGEGQLLGISPGTTTVIASAGGVDSAPVTVEVVAHQPPPASFTQVRAVTDGACAISGCHVDGVEPGDLRFDRDPDDLWEELLEDGAEQVAGLERVVPNAPSESYLVHKLVERQPAVGVQMPIGGAPMDATEVQVIVRWILDGAPFN